MFCPNCGAQVDDDAQFCGNCGAPLNGVEEDKVSETETDLQDNQEAETSRQEFIHTTTGKVTVGSIAVCLIIGVVIGAITLLNTDQAEPEPEMAETEPETEEAEAHMESTEEIAETELEIVEEKDEYILPDSDIRYYSSDELADYDSDTLRIARNEIYARHGRMFDSEDLQEYFKGQSWYQGTVKSEDFDENTLNEYEKANIDTIKALERGSTISSGSFEDSWNTIQEYRLITEKFDSRDLDDSKYFCTSLSFTIDGSTPIDKGDYYEVRAVFNKPALVPRNMKIGDQYTIYTDELKGTTTVLIGAEDRDGIFCLFKEGAEGEQDYGLYGDDRGYGWYGDFDGQDGYTDIWADDGGILEVPFYDGVLRVRKDAVTGNILGGVPYETITVSDLEGKYGHQEGLWSNYTAFDENGYVTELVYNGP